MFNPNPNKDGEGDAFSAEDHSSYMGVKVGRP
jgi:preprotein translocase subunit SecA